MNQKIALKQLYKINKLKGNMRLAAEDWKDEYETLIATILSARSLDETTIKVCKLLFEKYPDVKSLSHADIEDVKKIIKPINFYKNKSKNIVNCAEVLMEKYYGNIPKEYAKLIELPGVGNKTANVFLSEYGKNAIAVDTHVYYISKYLEWTKSNHTEKVENDLKKLFPENYWSKINPILVKFGKKYRSKKEKNKLLDEIKKIKF